MKLQQLRYIWEVSRKIRAPKDETEYVTYSKLFGYRKATNFVLIVTLIDIATNCNSGEFSECCHTAHSNKKPDRVVGF